MKAIAYGNGRTGDIVHASCWGDYVDSKRSHDAQGRPLPWGMIGTLYLQESLKRELKGKSCAHCGKHF